jgi:hypothetical protein
MLISSTLESYNSLEEVDIGAIFIDEKNVNWGLAIGILEHSLQLILVNLRNL